MASKKTAAGMQLILASLKKNSKASYGEIKAAADKKKVAVYPIMYGRAKAMLGLVPMAKRGQGKTAKQKASKRGPGRPRQTGRRGPGRPRTTGRDPLDAVQGLLSSMRDNERENERLRKTLEKIGALINQAL